MAINTWFTFETDYVRNMRKHMQFHVTDEADIETFYNGIVPAAFAKLGATLDDLFVVHPDDMDSGDTYLNLDVEMLNACAERHENAWPGYELNEEAFEKYMSMELYHRVVLDTVYGDGSEEDEYLNAYLRHHQIKMEIVEAHGEAGGQPVIEYCGSFADLKSLMHDCFEIDDCDWMILSQ